MPAAVVFSHPRVQVLHGPAASYDGERPALIIANVYGALPPALHSVPMIVAQFRHRLQKLSLWCGTDLTHLWNWAGSEAVWCGNIDPSPLRAFPSTYLSDLKPDGWAFPYELPDRIISALQAVRVLTPDSDLLIWDGFAGRGTVGEAALAHGYRFTGMDVSGQRCDLMRARLEHQVRYGRAE